MKIQLIFINCLRCFQSEYHNDVFTIGVLGGKQNEALLWD